MAERGVQENEEEGQFGVQARRTLDALESNSWFLSHVENPRKATTSATRREDNNRIQEKDDQEMEATVFNSQETPSRLFTLGEL